MAIYYHVSTELEHDGVFTPRIPDTRHKQQEDVTIGRVSVAPSIEDCFTAIPNGGGRLDELNIMQRGYYLVVKVDTEKLGIQKEDMIFSEELYKKDLVRDADFTNEVWITKPFKVEAEDMFLIQLKDWEENPVDVFPHSIFEIADRDYEGDTHEAYSDIYHEHVPCSIAISDVEFVEAIVQEDMEITLYTENDYEEEELSEFVKEHYNADIAEANFGELSFMVKENSNLSKLFLYHREIIDV